MGNIRKFVHFCSFKKKSYLIHCNSFFYDDVSKTPGAKFYHWELRGVPLRIELGPRDMAVQSVTIADRLGSAKETVGYAHLESYVLQKLAMVQKELYERALKKRDAQWFKKEKLADFGKEVAEHGGFYQTGWCGRAECEQELRAYQATIRCVLAEQQAARCFRCDHAAIYEVLIAKAY